MKTIVLSRAAAVLSVAVLSEAVFVIEIVIDIAVVDERIMNEAQTRLRLRNGAAQAATLERGRPGRCCAAEHD